MERRSASVASAASAAGDATNMKGAKLRDALVKTCAFAGFAGHVATEAAVAIVSQAGKLWYARL
jgi:hypothetical protein